MVFVGGVGRVVVDEKCIVVIISMEQSRGNVVSQRSDVGRKEKQRRSTRLLVEC